MVIEYSTPARVGILGNPSDGFGGRTLGLAVPELSATVTLSSSDGVGIEQADDDQSQWASLGHLVEHVDRYGYTTGSQLLSAAVRTFVDVARSIAGADDGANLPVDSVASGFQLSYRTTIPRQVGLAGSSALVVSALRCLCSHSGIEIPDHVLASIALRVETEQLGINAGLQDRVVQCLGGAVSMNFGAMEVDARFGVAFGQYESLDVSILPPLFLAYREVAAEPSALYHSDIRARFDAGEPLVRDTMTSLAGLVLEGLASLRWGDHEQFGVLVERTMELRRGLGPLPSRQIELIDLAASLEAPATFAGSGGAVVGLYRDDEHLITLDAAFQHLDAKVLVLTPAVSPTGQ